MRQRNDLDSSDGDKDNEREQEYRIEQPFELAAFVHEKSGLALWGATIEIGVDTSTNPISIVR